MFIGIEVFGIAGVVRRGSRRENNDHLSSRWIKYFAAVDADRESKDFVLFSECIFLRNEREHTCVADIEWASSIFFCDPIIGLFCGFFCAFALGFVI